MSDVLMKANLVAFLVLATWMLLVAGFNWPSGPWVIALCAWTIVFVAWIVVGGKWR